MALILHLETTTKVCSVALSEGKDLLQLEERVDDHYSHAENLHVFIERVLTRAGKKTTDLQAVAVAQGPGSYTGLRIGVSTAKGLCFALKIPLIAVDPLKALATNITEPGLRIPMIDARRQEVFLSVFDQNLNCLISTKPQVITEEFPMEFEGNQLHLLGDGAQKFAGLFKSHSSITIHPIIASAKSMISLAHDSFIKNEFVDTAYFIPVYGKEFGQL